RFDLTLSDLVDKVSLVLDNVRFVKYREELDSIIQDPMNFYAWFLKLKEIADNDEGFFRSLDHHLFIQLYTNKGYALLPEYKYIDIKKIKDLGLLGRIRRYNAVLADPEGAGI